MNVRLVNCVLAVIGLLCVDVRGDVTALPADPPISPAAQSALNMTPFAGEFAKIGPEVDKLMQNATDPATVSMVRGWLIDQDPPAATNPYQEAYASALNDAFVKALADPKSPIAAKINIGIVIKSLSGPKANLAPTIVLLLNDPNAVVALWGIKSAAALLPGALADQNFNANGGRDAVLGAIISAVATHPDGPLAAPIAEQAYDAINPKQWNVNVIPTGQALAALIAANLELQKQRLAIYFNKGVPAFPQGDSYPSFFLFSNPAWSAMNPAQQLQAAQQAANYVAWVGDRYAAAAAANANQDLIEGLKGEGKWISKLGGLLSDDPAIQSAGDDVNKLTAGSPAATVQQVCGAVFGALQQNPAPTSLTLPPPIGGAPATVPGAVPGGAAGAPPAAGVPKSASDNSAGTSPTSEARQ